MVTRTHLQYNLNHAIKFCWWRHQQELWRHKYTVILRRPGLAIFAEIIKILKKCLKTQEKLKELEIIYQNAIYICISWYNKICWFSVKKWWFQQNSGGASRDSYVFWIFFRYGIIVPSFITVGYLWQILGRGALFAPPPHPWAAPKMPILNRVKNSFLNSLSKQFLFQYFQQSGRAWKTWS